MSENDGYKVGPGRPPREHQFKKNQSGNPGGKKKGTLNVKTLLLQELTAEATTKKGEKIPVIVAIIRQHVRNAAGGNERAIERVITRLERYETATPEHQEDLQEDDEAILLRFGYASSGGSNTEEGDVDDE